MISESQERMVAVLSEDLVAVAEEIFARWELAHAVIGSVTDTGDLRVFFDGEVVGEIPARLLTDECPRYDVERASAPRASLPFRERLDGPNLRSRGSVYEQYDQLVGSRTVRRPGLDAAVLRLRPSFRGLAVSLDGPPVGERDPFRAGALAALDAARNVACAGGEPLALTDCLNFGNPEKAEIGWELAEAIEGLARAAEALGVPIVSGNVSLYNETDGRAIPPTPVVGCVGLVPDVRRVPRGWRDGDTVYVVTLDNVVDLEAHAALVARLWQLAPDCSLVHDVSDGGLEVALAEAALWTGVGADVEPIEDAVAILASRTPLDLPRLGEAGGDTLLGRTLAELREAYG
jgi:phosphoribosylformylglycinamidine synthase